MLRTRLTAAVVASAAAVALVPSPAHAAGPPTGKYGCSESVYSPDGYRFEARGFVSLLAGGRYRQNKGKTGTYRTSGTRTTFKGGDLAGSFAEPIDGDRTHLRLTVKFSGGDTARWSCRRIGKA